MSSYADLPYSLSVVDFWFSEEVQSFWFAKDKEFDENLRVRFAKTYQDVVETHQNEGMDHYKSGIDALADVIVLDQFSRNMFRNTPQAFATDDLALALSKYAIQKKFDKDFPSLSHRNFLYMPFMHSENLEDQEESVRLFSSIPKNEGAVIYAKHHRDIIARFGRFPHRNNILGRASTAEEIEFMKEFSGF